MSDLTSNGLDVKGPGFTASVRGPLTIVTVVLLLGFSGLALMMRDDANKRMAEHAKIIQAMNDQACMLAIPQDIRPHSLNDPFGICHFATQVMQLGQSQRSK